MVPWPKAPVPTKGDSAHYVPSSVLCTHGPPVSKRACGWCLRQGRGQGVRASVG